MSALAAWFSGLALGVGLSMLVAAFLLRWAER